MDFSWQFSTSNPYIDGRVRVNSVSNGAEANNSAVRVYVDFRRNNEYSSWGVITTHSAVENIIQSQDTSVEMYSDWINVSEKAWTIGHNDDGSKNAYIRVWGEADFGLSFDTNYSVPLDKIARYTSITKWELSTDSSSSLTFDWATADIISYIQCQIGSTVKYKSSVNAKSGKFTISGLTEHTTYSNIKITVTRKDSGLTTASKVLSCTTPWALPTANIKLKSTSINSMVLTCSSSYPCSDIWIYSSGINVYHATNLNTSTKDITLVPTDAFDIKPNTQYRMAIKVKRKASGETRTSAALFVTTLRCPYITSQTPTSFNIGSSITARVDGASNSAYSLILQYYNGSTWVTDKTTSLKAGVNSVTISPTATTLYAACKTSNSLPVRIACQVTQNGKTETTYYNITAKVVNSDPTFSDFTWTTNDNTPINDIIGGTTNMITGIGKLFINFADSCATAKNSASITEIEIALLFSDEVILTKRVDYSESAFTSRLLLTGPSTAGTYTLRCVAIDGRGNTSAAKTHSFTVYKYHKPVLSISMQRYNNFEANTLISVNGQASKLLISSVQKNSIVSLKYRYSVNGNGYPSTYTSITDYSTTAGSGDDLLLTYSKQSPDSPFLTLDYEKSYNFQFILTDKLYGSNAYEVFVGQGNPALGIFQNGIVTVNKVPNFDNSAKLQVGGDVSATADDGTEIYLAETINNLSDNTTSLNNSIKSINTSLDKKQDSMMGGTAEWGSIDNITTPGTYWCELEHVTGSPYTSGYGYLEVLCCTTIVRMQRITRFVTSGNGQIAVRYYANSKWYGWKTTTLS